MQINTQTINALINDKSWKGPLYLGIAALIIAALLGSPYFLALKILAELIFFLGGLLLVGVALYRVYMAKSLKSLIK